MNCSMPGLPVHHQLRESIQIHVHLVDDAIQPSIQSIAEVIIVVQSLSHVWFFVTPWTAACHASLSFTISRSLLKLMSIEQWCHPTISSSVVPFSSCPQSFPASVSFQMSQLFTLGGQSIRASGSASVLPMNIQNWFSLGLIWLLFFFFAFR